MSTWAQATQRAIQRIPERTRCVPEFTGCPQLSRCACASSGRRGTVVDASVSIKTLGFCPMFVDVRGPGKDAE